MAIQPIPYAANLPRRKRSPYPLLTVLCGLVLIAGVAGMIWAKNMPGDQDHARKLMILRNQELQLGEDATAQVNKAIALMNDAALATAPDKPQLVTKATDAMKGASNILASLREKSIEFEVETSKREMGKIRANSYFWICGLIALFALVLTKGSLSKWPQGSKLLRKFWSTGALKKLKEQEP